MNFIQLISLCLLVHVLIFVSGFLFLSCFGQKHLLNVLTMAIQLRQTFFFSISSVSVLISLLLQHPPALPAYSSATERGRAEDSRAGVEGDGEGVYLPWHQRLGAETLHPRRRRHQGSLH